MTKKKGRPISFMNHDAKITNALNPEYSKELLGWFNIWKSMNKNPTIFMEVRRKNPHAHFNR